MLETRVDQLTQDLATLRRQVAQFQRDEAQRQTETLAEKAQDISGVPVVAATVDVPDDRVLREMGEMVLSKLGRPGVVVLAGNSAPIRPANAASASSLKDASATLLSQLDSVSADAQGVRSAQAGRKENAERVGIHVSVSPELTRRGLHAGKIAGAVGQRLGGKGGGRPESAQGGGKNKAELGTALALVPKLVKESLG